MANEKRLIDANKYPCFKCEAYGCGKVCDMLKEWLTSTVDAVEVVRCEKCQWFNKKGFEADNRQQAMPELDLGWCSTHHRIMQACMFCSYGERREGE